MTITTPDPFREALVTIANMKDAVTRSSIREFAAEVLATSIDELRLQDQANDILTKRIKEAKALIRETLDVPTLIDAKANCRNLTKCLQQVERILP